jgi:hypothetical protein
MGGLEHIVHLLPAYCPAPGGPSAVLRVWQAVANWSTRPPSQPTARPCTGVAARFCQPEFDTELNRRGPAYARPAPACGAAAGVRWPVGVLAQPVLRACFGCTKTPPPGRDADGACRLSLEEPLWAEICQHLVPLPAEDLRSKQSADDRPERDAAVGNGLVVTRHRR